MTALIQVFFFQNILDQPDSVDPGSFSKNAWIFKNKDSPLEDYPPDNPLGDFLLDSPPENYLRDTPLEDYLVSIKPCLFQPLFSMLKNKVRGTYEQATAVGRTLLKPTCEK
jgi:hypothetical protein